MVRVSKTCGQTIAIENKLFEKEAMSISVELFAGVTGSLSLVFMLAYVVLTCVVVRKLRHVKKRISELERWKDSNAKTEESPNHTLSYKCLKEDPASVTAVEYNSIESIQNDVDSPSSFKPLSTDEKDANTSQEQRRRTPGYANVMVALKSEVSRNTLNDNLSSSPSMEEYISESSSRPIIYGEGSCEPDYINVMISHGNTSVHPTLETSPTMY